MNLLLTGAWRDAGRYISLLERHGHRVVWMQNESDALPCSPEWVEGVVCNGLFLSHSADAFTSLKYVQLTSAGYDRVPLHTFTQRGVTLRNARGVYSIPMAEHAVAGVLHFFRNSRFFFENQQKHLWQKDRTLRELCGSTVCIIGCGSVGTECAKRFEAFGCKVIGIDIESGQRQFFSRIYPIGELYDAIGDADAVILTLPLTPETKGLANERFFKALKDGCVLVNVARGAVVQTQAMIDALNTRHLFAALDVFEEEPLDPADPLWSLDNVIITPHNSFVSDRTADRLSRLILDGLTERSEGIMDEDSDCISQK